MMRERTRLYLITPPRLDADFAATLRDALSGGDVSAVQLRLKEVDDATIRAAAKQLLPIVQEAGAAFILNDRPDLADAVGADGVHVGQEDASYGEARRIMGPDRIVGVTCHDSRHLAMEAGEAGADYVAFGAFYPSDTKTPPTVADAEILEWWQALMEVPCVAIGGITVDNAIPLVRAGADFIAASNGVWRHPQGPKAAVAAFNAVFDT
ncbi:MAG: thiamine phosphate synthase [Alphaproteobacteria bacterium]|nr:thiamine phosphate synthase [Alphaproteobacteria bacterium]